MSLPSILLGAGAGYLMAKGHKPSDAEVMGWSDEWIQTVCRHNPNEVILRYAEDGVLVGTVAQKIKQGRAEIKTYFDMFLAKKDLCGTYTSHLVQAYDDWAIDSGTYTFTWKEGGKQVVVPARFTFVYRKTDEGWKIANHHSSALPE